MCIPERPTIIDLGSIDTLPYLQSFGINAIILCHLIDSNVYVEFQRRFLSVSSTKNAALISKEHGFAFCACN